MLFSTLFLYIGTYVLKYLWNFFQTFILFHDFFPQKSIPTCIDYSFDEEDPEGESLLMFGDADGSITVVNF